MKNFKLLVIALLSIITFSNCEKDDPLSPGPQLPRALFTLNTSTAKVGEVLTFSNQSQNATSYKWDFGDGNISTDKNPTHVYSTDGNFDVKLTAIGGGGVDTSIKSINIEVIKIPPAGSYTGKTAEGKSISFSIQDNKVINFSGSYLISDGTSTYLFRVSIPSYGTMSETNTGFTVTSHWGKKLTGTFDNNTIEGYWEHDAGSISYTVDKR